MGRIKITVKPCHKYMATLGTEESGHCGEVAVTETVGV